MSGCSVNPKIHAQIPFFQVIIRALFFNFSLATYQMLLTINGQPQMSFEQFQETFREAFGRDMTPDERRWFEPAFLKPELNTAFLGDAA